MKGKIIKRGENEHKKRHNGKVIKGRIACILKLILYINDDNVCFRLLR